MSAAAGRSPLISYRAVPPLDGALDERRRGGESASAVARRDLERYYRALAQELRGSDLTVPEAHLISDAVRWAGGDPAGLPAAVADAIRIEDIDAACGIDVPALTARVAAWTPGLRCAIWDAAERVDWRAMDTAAQLRAVGLVRGDPPSGGST